MPRRPCRVPPCGLPAAPYAYAAVVAPGAPAFTAGACSLDAEGRTVAPGDIPAQARKVFENLRAALARAGCDLGDVVKTTVYVVACQQADLLAP